MAYKSICCWLTLDPPASFSKEHSVGKTTSSLGIKMANMGWASSSSGSGLRWRAQALMKELLRAWGDPHTWGFSPVPRTSSWCPYTARLVVGIDFSKAIEMADKRAFIKKNDQVRLIKHVLSSQKMTPLFRQIKPMIVKNIPFANLLKSFWNKIIPTANLQC